MKECVCATYIFKQSHLELAFIPLSQDDHCIFVYGEPSLELCDPKRILPAASSAADISPITNVLHPTRSPVISRASSASPPPPSRLSLSARSSAGQAETANLLVGASDAAGRVSQTPPAVGDDDLAGDELTPTTTGRRGRGGAARGGKIDGEPDGGWQGGNSSPRLASAAAAAGGGGTLR